MPNSVKKNRLQQEPDAAPEVDVDDFDIEALDELATFMVEALTIPLSADFRNPDGTQTSNSDEPAARPARRLN